MLVDYLHTLQPVQLSLPAKASDSILNANFLFPFWSLSFSPLYSFRGKKDLINVISYSKQFAIGNYTITLYK